MSKPSYTVYTKDFANIVCRRLERENKKKDKEIDRLENIIKEVREKLLRYGETFDLKVHQQMQKELLQILDKEK